MQPAPERPFEASDDDEGRYVPPDPFKLKELGNAHYKEGEYAVCIEFYKKALKEALKRSVRAPSKEIVDLQMSCRLNLAIAFYREEDFVMSKEHLMVVLEQRPEHVKAHYWLGKVYLALQDYDRAKSIVEKGLQDCPDDAALKALQRDIIVADSDYRRACQTTLKKRIDLNIGDERSDSRQDAELFVADPYATLLNDRCNEKKDLELLEKLCRALIDWRHNTQNLLPNESHEDTDDFESNCWILPYSPERLKDDRRALVYSLPFSILAIMENCIRLDESRLERKQLTSTVLPPLPPLENANSTSVLEVSLRRQAVGWLSRMSSHSMKTRPLTIHVIGARGDCEMECKWAAMLDRMPHVDQLQVIMIGFCDPNDPYSRRLKGEDYFSPPLTKKSAFRLFQKFTARLYKGSYQDFLQSKSVNSSIETNFPSIDLPIGENGEKVALSPVLSAPSHPFHPDLIVIPEPNLSRWFDSWVPALAHILLANIPLVVFGYSVMEGSSPSHEALNIKPILKALKARVVLPLSWNPFSVPIHPGEDCPPMPITTRWGEEIQFTGVSGKFAVSIMVCGVESSGNVDQTRAYLASLMTDAEAVAELREKLHNLGVDTKKEMMNWEGSRDYFKEMAAEAEGREEKIEQKAQDIADILKDKMTKLGDAVIP